MRLPSLLKCGNIGYEVGGRRISNLDTPNGLKIFKKSLRKRAARKEESIAGGGMFRRFRIHLHMVTLFAQQLCAGLVDVVTVGRDEGEVDGSAAQGLVTVAEHV